MIVIPTTQEEINKEKNIPALIKNRYGLEMVIDLYTAKRLAIKNECEILDENFSQRNESPVFDTEEETTVSDTETGADAKAKTPKQK